MSSDPEIESLNQLQEPPTTFLTEEPLSAYEMAKETIRVWDPFRGITVRYIDEVRCQGTETT